VAAEEQPLPDARAFRPSRRWMSLPAAAVLVALYTWGLWKLAESPAPAPPPRPESIAAAVPPAPAPETPPPAPAPEAAPPAPAAPPPAPEPPAVAAPEPPAVAAPEPPAASPLPSRPPDRRPAATRRRAVAAREAPPPAARQDRILLQLMERKSDAEVDAQVEPEQLDSPASFLDTEQAARTVGRQQRAFEACASSALRRNPALVRDRKVTMAVVVASTGRVTQASVDDPDIDADPLGLCLKSACRRMVFPPFDGPPVLVEVPLALGKGQ
jgi:outer membrane biosynthesis protein TonB